MKVLLLSIVFVCAILPSIESSEYHGSNAFGHVSNKVYRSRGEVYNRGNLRDELRELQTTLYKIGERIKEFVKNNFNGVYNTMIAAMKAVEKTSSLDSVDRKASSDEGYFKEVCEVAGSAQIKVPLSCGGQSYRRKLHSEQLPVNQIVRPTMTLSYLSAYRRIPRMPLKLGVRVDGAWGKQAFLLFAYAPPVLHNIWQRSIHPNPRKFSIRKVKKHFGSNLVPDEMNRSTYTPDVTIGQTRRTIPLTALTGTLPKVVELASHGETGRAENSQKHIAGTGEQLVSSLVKVNHLTSTNQSNQAENQYSDGVTPPPTDKSGRGGKR
ncbi:hypothetical protein J6590_086448 [Homalodisca vitripennis]|nr:hypothetical protein J6590_086448 [Homalodisca vitripennis]